MKPYIQSVLFTKGVFSPYICQVDGNAFDLVCELET